MPPSALVLRIELVDVDQRVARAAPSEVLAGQAGVADRQAHAAGQLALHVDRYCCTYGAPFDGSTKRMSPPAPVSRPRLLPVGCTMPFGNGLSIVVVGTDPRSADSDQRGRRVADLAPPVSAGRRVVPRRVVEAPAAAHDGLRVHAVDHADARRDFHRRLIALLGRRAV